MSFLPISIVFYRTGFSCKTALIETFQPASVHHLPNDTMAIQYHRRRSGMSFFFFFFRILGIKLVPTFLKIHFKRVIPELSTPICKRKESNIHGCGFFPLEVSLPALDEGVDRLSTKVFLPWSACVCPLPTQVPSSSLPRSYHESGVEMHQE